MPHFHIEYSANLETVVDIGALCDAIRVSATGVDAFPDAGIRVRAIRVDHVSIADGNPDHGFIDLSIRLRAGRSDEIKRDAIEQVFGALKEFMAPAMQTRSVALSSEIRDIVADMSPKFGNIRDHLETRS